ncbi:DUF2304 domain-containing protein [Candidatus Microgenomates bacterium]|nr:DUF2304 domain-containing protein [Candidatus Microgenomates bacterium]
MQSAQIILTAIIVFIIHRTFATYRKGKLTKVFTFLWLLFWLVLLFFIYQQQLLSNIAHFFGVSRGVDLGLYLSVIIIFYLIFKLFSALEEVNQKLTQLIRKDAITNLLKRSKRA